MAISCTSISAVLGSQGDSLRVFSQLVYSSHFKVHSHQSCLLQITLCSVCCFSDQFGQLAEADANWSRSHRFVQTEDHSLCQIHTTHYNIANGWKVFASVYNTVFITFVLVHSNVLPVITNKKCHLKCWQTITSEWKKINYQVHKVSLLTKHGKMNVNILGP